MKKTAISIFILILLLIMNTEHAFQIQDAKMNKSIRPMSPDPTTIWVQPSNITLFSDEAYVGYRFNVTFWIETDQEVGGVQINTIFKHNIINVTQWWEPTWNSSYIFYGETTSALPTPPNPGYAQINATHSRSKISVSLFPPPPNQPAFTGTGLIAILEFEVKSLPTETTPLLTSSIHINNSDTYVMLANGTQLTEFTKTDGWYEIHYQVAPPSKAWLEAFPSQVEMSKPRPFNVSVLIKNVSEANELIGVQFMLKFNMSNLEVLDIIEGDFLKQFANHGTLVSYRVDDVWEAVVYTEMILPNDTGQWDLPVFPNGEGEMAKITFLPKYHEQVSFNLTIEPVFGNFFMDVDGTWLPYSEPRNCSYTYTPLALPLLRVEPSRYVSSEVGETFEVNITINDLDAAWNLTSIDFKLSYNGTFLKVLNVTEGPFMAQFGTTEFSYNVTENYIETNISLTTITNSPSGSGTLVTITFNSTLKPPATCPLDLYDIIVKDTEGYDILYDIVNGFYTMEEHIIHEIVWSGMTFHVETLSNASVSSVIFDQPHRLIHFNVTGWSGVLGFVNVTIPKSLLYADPEDWLVIVGGVKVVPVVTELDGSVLISFMWNFSSTVPVYIVGTSAATLTYTLIIDSTVGGTTHPSPGTYTYENGTVVSVIAIPEEGYQFSHWLLNGSTITDNPINITMIANYNLTAVFTLPPPPPSVPLSTKVYDVTAAGQTFQVELTSNSTLPDDIIFDVDHRLLNFTLEGNSTAVCFVNITIPKGMLKGDNNWLVLANGIPMDIEKSENATHTSIWFYFTFESKETIQVIGTWAIPEMSSLTLLALLVILAAAVMMLRRKITFKA